MANKCIHRKVNGVLSDANIPKFCYFKIHIKNLENSRIVPFWMQSTGTIKANIIGNGYFYKGAFDNRTDQSTSIEASLTTQGWRISEGEYDIEMSSEYEMTNIHFASAGSACNCAISFDMNSLKYAPLVEIVNNNFGKDLGSPITGEWIPTVTDFTVRGTHIEISTEQFAKLGDMGVSIYGVSYITDKLYGPVEWFADSDNAKSGQNYLISAPLMGERVTFNGENTDYAVRVIVDASGNGTVKKENDGSILATYTKATDTWVYNN